MSDILNFAALSDDRFERVCKSIIEIDTNLPFHTYAKGKDGGIDIRCFIDDEHQIVCQCKNYVRSTYKDLFKALKAELPKVESLQPSNYYLFISLNLTPSNVDEIYNLFQQYMPNGREQHIYFGNNINDRLSKPKYRVVCENNFDLFAESKSVQDLFLNAEIIRDSEALLGKIDESSSLLVKIRKFDDAFRKLINKHNVLITGEPGIGKTALSKLLIKEFRSHFPNSEFHFSSTKNIGSLKRIMSPDPSVVELFYVDDFLGRAYFEIKQDTINDLKYFLIAILNSKKKYVILNSRRSVLNEANSMARTLSFSFSNDIFNIESIDISDLSYRDKGLILYNHIVTCGLDKPRIEELKTDKFYKTIINHRSFSPRLIEFIVNRSFYSKADVSNYKALILESLQNPKTIYTEDLSKNHHREDRLFLYAVRSFDTVKLDEALFKDYFTGVVDSSICGSNYLNSDQIYEECLSRLNDYYIKQYSIGKSHFITLSNPSIYDFIDNNMGSEDAEYLKTRAKYIEQLLYFDKEFFGKKYLNWYGENENEYGSLSFPDETLYSFYLFYGDDPNSFVFSRFKKFLCSKLSVFSHENIGVSGESFFLTLFNKYHVDSFLSEDDTSSTDSYWIISNLGRYFKGPDLFDVLAESLEKNDSIKAAFVDSVVERLYDDYYSDVDMLGIIRELDYKEAPMRDSEIDDLVFDVKDRIKDQFSDFLYDSEEIDHYSEAIDFTYFKKAADEYIEETNIRDEVVGLFANDEDDSWDYHSSFSQGGDSEQVDYIDSLFSKL